MEITINKRVKQIGWILGLAASISTPSMADNSKIIHQLVHANEVVKVDGVLDESVWQQATHLNLQYNINPGENTPAPVKTDLYLYENGESLFVAFKAYDPEPEKIRAYFRDRDTLFQDDFVGIVLDTFNDNRRAYEFFVNPFGVQGDLIKDDTQGGNEDSNWDAIWSSAGQITKDGYIVEMEIPFSALRFPADQSDMTWGIQALRLYPRDSRMVMSNSTVQRGVDCSLCQFEKIKGLSDLSQGNNFQITPTLTYSRSENKDSVPGPWNDAQDDTQAGVDLRWGINENLYLNATINPDFSQVEADAAQLDINNTFSLFVNEKRPFFLDGRDYFSTQRMNLVHTRNINAPEYGAKLTGKQNQHTYGLLVANDEATSFLMPGNQGSSVATLDQSSQVLVGRYRLDIGKRNNIGGIVTSRKADGYSNTVASIDGYQQFTKADSLSYQVAYSDSSNPLSVQNDFGLAASQQDLSYSLGYRHNTRDYGLRASHMKMGEDFRADLGFVGRTGYHMSVIGGNYDWYGDEGSKWTRYGIFGDYDKTYAADGTMLEEEIELHGNVQGPKQFYTNFGIVARKSYWAGEYYKVNNFMMYARFDPLRNLRLSAFTRIGDQIDYANNRLGDSIFLDLGSEFKIGTHLNGRISYVHDRLDIDAGNVYTANQYDVRINYNFSLLSYLRLTVQYTDIEQNQALYIDSVDKMYKGMRTELLYAYKLNPQSLLYIGYTDQGYQDDNLQNIEKNNRKVFMKLSYAFQM
ncbi:DUF5916 domain-containing protein [Paraglaciecola aestuariivivens]